MALVDVTIQVWHMIEITRRDFSDHHQIQAPITKNQLETIGMMSHFTEQLGMDYFEVFDYRYEAQPGNYFFFHGKEKDPRRTEFEEDEGFSATRTQVSEPRRPPLALEARSALHSIESFLRIQLVEALFDL